MTGKDGSKPPPAEGADVPTLLGVGPPSPSAGADAGERERRGGARYLACFPARVEAGEGDVRSALIRDLSVTGARLLALSSFEVGQRLSLALHLLSASEEPVVVNAVVVRDERRPLEVSFPWTHTVAVRFEAPRPDLEPLAIAMADKQDATFGRQR